MSEQGEQVLLLIAGWEKRAEFYRGVQQRAEPGPEWREAKHRAGEIETCVRALKALLSPTPGASDDPV